VESEKLPENGLEITIFILFEVKKSDVQVRRVNTFHILQTIRKRPSNFRLCMEGTLRFLKFQILRTKLYFLTPNYQTKVPPDLFHSKIC
jgi:hypothetical protein